MEFILQVISTFVSHDREFIWGPRGFKSVEEMNAALIERWNNTVSESDIVYVLGDFFLGRDYDFIDKTLNQLNGNIYVIIGNHDTPAKDEFYSRHPKVLSIAYADMIVWKKRVFYLSHYPTFTSDLQCNPKHAIFNLFGHTHSNKKFFEDRPYMYNVAADAHNCTPVSIEQIYTDIDNEINKCISFLDEI